MSQKIQVLLWDESIDTIAKMMIGYVLNMPKEEPEYQKKVESTVEFLEEVLDASFTSIATYLIVLELMPITVKRKLPFRIEEFIRMYGDRIEEVLGNPIPSKYRPQSLVTKDLRLLNAEGNPIGGENGGVVRP